MEDGIAWDIYDPRKGSFSILYPVGVCVWWQSTSATTKGVWSFFRFKDLIHET